MREIAACDDHFGQCVHVNSPKYFRPPREASAPGPLMAAKPESRYFRRRTFVAPPRGRVPEGSAFFAEPEQPPLLRIGEEIGIADPFPQAGAILAQRLDAFVIGHDAGTGSRKPGCSQCSSAAATRLTSGTTVWRHSERLASA